MGGRSDRKTGLATHALLERPHQVPKPPPKLPASLCSEILPVISLLYFPMQSAMLCPSYPALLFLHALLCSPLQCLEMPSNGLQPGSPKQPTTYHLPSFSQPRLISEGDPTKVKFLHAFAKANSKQSKSGDQIWMLPETATPALVFVLMGKI